MDALGNARILGMPAIPVDERNFDVLTIEFPVKIDATGGVAPFLILEVPLRHWDNAGGLPALERGRDFFVERSPHFRIVLQQLGRLNLDVASTLQVVVQKL